MTQWTRWRPGSRPPAAAGTGAEPRLPLPPILLRPQDFYGAAEEVELPFEQEAGDELASWSKKM